MFAAHFVLNKMLHQIVISSMISDLNLFLNLANELLNAEKEEAVLKPINPDELYNSLDLSLTEDGSIKEDFEKALKELVLNTPRTATNMFYNQLFGGRQSKAVLGDLLAVLLNNSMYTYKVAGPQVGVEKEIIHRSVELIGYNKNADGTISSGGSMSNMMAMLMARDHHNISITKEGVQAKLIAYTSEHSHYSIPKNASLIGIGLDQVRRIPTDEKGVMIVDELEAAIKEDIGKGNQPFFVNATAGTTVLGAFDPIRQISVITKKYKLWLHVDGAYCGSVIFSDKYKHLVDGIEESDSFNYNAHKMLGTPLTCSVIITKHRKCLYESFSIDADYLYQTDKDDYNLGKTSLQCGRRNDALKLWTLWKSVGRKGIEQIVDKQFYLANIAREYVSNNPDYTLYSYPDSISICFNYKNIPANELCTALYEKGEILVGFGQFNDQEFIRLVTVNANNGKEEILEFFRRMEAFANANF